jgi:hypothetical protein
VYIGSTSKKYLSQRLTAHVSSYKRYLLGKTRWISSFEIMKNNNYSILLLESYPCNDKDELTSRERYFIESMECVNKYIPNRTYQESLEKTRKYKENNKEHIKIYKQRYNLENRDTIKKQKQNNYYKNHNTFLERSKRYKEENKERLNEKFDCECGGRYTYRHKKEHFETKKHKSYENSLQIP